MARILVIDDEEGIRYTFESFLTDEGHAVSTAGDYKEGVHAVADAEFDLVISDIVLGDKTGIDVLRTMRERGQNCPVVIITGNPTAKTESDAMRLGAFEYIPKPVQKEALLAVTGRALAHKALPGIHTP
jgi:DNA-binding NtrC family response regulator